MAAFEEASKCPKCGFAGEVGKPKPIPRTRDRLVQLTCRSPGCRWENTSWTVQIRPDGSVPDPDPRPRPKQFPERKGGLVIANAMDVVEKELRDLEATTRPGGAEMGKRG